MAVFTVQEECVVVFENVMLGVRVTIDTNHFLQGEYIGILWTAQIIRTPALDMDGGKSIVAFAYERTGMGEDFFTELELLFDKINSVHVSLESYTVRLLYTTIVRCTREDLKKYKEWKDIDPYLLEEVAGAG